MTRPFGPEPWRRRRLPNWLRMTAPTAVISLPVNGFSATIGVPVTLDPTNTTDPDDAWVGTWTITGVGAVVRFTHTGTFNNFASHVTSWTPTIAEGVTVDWVVTDGSGQQDSAQVTGNVVPAGVPKIVLTTQPSTSAQNGVNFGTVPVFQLRDASNNNLAIAGVSIIVTSSAGTLAMSPQPIVTNSSGTASPSTIKITGTTGSYTITGAATGYTSATSNAITLTPGTIVTAQCTATGTSSGTTGVATTITITARDTSGNALTTGGETFAVAVTGANTNSGNATDNANGTYTRQYTPTVAGTDSIAVTRSAVHISGSPFTSVISAPSALYANRFAGHTTVFETDWRQDPTPEPSAGSSEGWSDFGSGQWSFITSSGSIVTSAPISNDSVLTCRYKANQTKGTAIVRLSWQNSFPANTGWFYSAGWVYIPSNVTWNGNPLGKIQFVRDGGQNNHYWGFYGESMRLVMGLQKPVEFAQYRSNNGIGRNAWHKWEIRGEPNTPGTANGVIRMWIDGSEQQISKNGDASQLGRTDVLWWQSGQTAAWTGLFADMIYGGNTFNSPNFDMDIHYDRWYMAVK
jgi:hypothetical protein